ncbi:MAG TPA: hypothetical protein VK174_18965 [Chitinophagales bacterium]|nr:hypothetical protein [Chitinophagales bacterium]
MGLQGQIFSNLNLAPPSVEGRKNSPHNSRIQALPVSSKAAIPTVNFTGNKVIGLNQRTIENPTNKSISFRFSNLAQTDSQFIADYIWDSIQNPSDTEQTKLDIVRACVRFVKSRKNYTNRAHIFGGQWQDTLLYKKEHSLIGRIYSTYSTQCGNSAQHARAIQLYKTPFFKHDDFRHVDVPNHEFIETRLWNYYAMTDYDVASYGFMFENPNSPNGFASFEDVRNDTLLVNEKYLENGQDFNPYVTRSSYRETLSESPANVYISTEGAPPIELNGEFIIPAYSKITTNFAGPIFFLDSTNPANMLALAQAFELSAQAENSGCIPCITDSVNKIVQSLWHIDSTVAALLLNGSSMVLYDPQNDQGRAYTELFTYEYPRDSTPAWFLHTNSDDTLWIGCNKDIKMPLFVLEASRGLIGDTFIAQNAVFPLWNPGNTASILTYKEVNYLEEGFLLPGRHTTKLSVNANLIGNFNEWNISGGDSLKITTTYIPLSTDTITTSVKTITPATSDLLYYWTDSEKLYVSANCQLVNMLGQTILNLPAGTTDLGWVARGTYVLYPYRKQILVR